MGKLTTLLESPLWDPAYDGTARHSDNDPDPTQRPAPPLQNADQISIEQAGTFIEGAINTAEFEGEVGDVASKLFDLIGRVYIKTIGDMGNLDLDDSEDTLLRHEVTKAVLARLSQQVSPDGE